MRRLFLGLILASTSPFFPHSAKAHGTTLHQTPTEGERVKGLIELLRPSGMGWVGSKKRVAATRFLGSHPGIAKTIFDIPVSYTHLTLPTSG